MTFQEGVRIQLEDMRTLSDEDLLVIYNEPAPCACMGCFFSTECQVCNCQHRTDAIKTILTERNLVSE